MNPTFLIILLFIAGCATKQNQNRLDNDRFKLPLVIQKEKTDTVKAFSVDAMMGIYPPLIGKFKFGDTINFSKLIQQQMTEKDYLWEVQNAYESDSLSSDGLQIIPDYNTSIAYSRFESTNQLYFPVYVVNETYEPRIFFGKDSHGFAVQEAIDTSDYSLWHPIEATGYDFCGNGRFRKKINPKEFLVFLMPKYFGSDTTSLRIRFQIGESVFISKTFIGTINPKQFDIDKKDWIYDRLKESKGDAASFIFYGGRPKGSWD
jgi:hypothetical protein